MKFFFYGLAIGAGLTLLFYVVRFFYRMHLYFKAYNLEKRAFMELKKKMQTATTSEEIKAAFIDYSNRYIKIKNY